MAKVDYKDTYVESMDKQQKIKELYDLTKTILQSTKINDKYKRRFLDGILWDITEIDGKHNTKYRSSLVVDKDYIGKVIHEHVFTKKFLIDKLLRYPKAYEQILNITIACLVTPAEHKRLHKYKSDDNWNGWKRYNCKDENKCIIVRDMVTNTEVDLNDLINKQNKDLAEIENIK